VFGREVSFCFCLKLCLRALSAPLPPCLPLLHVLPHPSCLWSCCPPLRPTYAPHPTTIRQAIRLSCCRRLPAANVCCGASSTSPLASSSLHLTRRVSACPAPHATPTTGHPLRFTPRKATWSSLVAAAVEAVARASLALLLPQLLGTSCPASPSSFPPSLPRIASSSRHHRAACDDNQLVIHKRRTQPFLQGAQPPALHTTQEKGVIMIIIRQQQQEQQHRTKPPPLPPLPQQHPFRPLQPPARQDRGCLHWRSCA